MNFTETQREFYESLKKSAQKCKEELGCYPELDMHTHSNMSDGLFSIPQLIFIAKELGIKMLFITDHNTCLPGYLVFKSLSEDFLEGIEVSIGCEIATKIEDPVTGKFIPIEILSYYANPYQLQSFLNKYDFANNISQDEQLKTLLSICDKLSLQHSDNFIIPDGCYATEILCRDLIEYEKNKTYFSEHAPLAWNTPKLFYKTCVSNPDSDFYIDTTDGLPYYKDTVEAINDAGGYAIGAHMFLYSRNSSKHVKALMDTLVSNTNISGFEAGHSNHALHQRLFIIDYAEKHGLSCTCGTDFHKGPHTILGYGNINSPFAVDKSVVSFFKNISPKLI